MNSQLKAADHVQMGLTYFAIGKHEEAIEEYKKAIDTDPNCLDARYHLAIVYAKGREKKINEAIQELKKIIDINLKFRITCLLLADLYYSELHNFGEAERWYRKALTIENIDPWELFVIYDYVEIPYHARVQNQLGVMIANQGRKDEALEHYKNAIEIDPTYSLPRYNLGIAYLNDRQIDKAIEQFNAILKVDPIFRDTYFYMGKAYADNGELDKAIPYFNKEIENNPKNTDAYFALAGINANSGNFDEAIQYYNEVVRNNPEHHEAHALLGTCYIMKEKFTEGIPFLKKALEINPDNAFARNNLAHAYQKIGENDLASHELEEITKIDNAEIILKEIEIAHKEKEREQKPFKDWEEKWKEKNVPRIRPDYVPKDIVEVLLLKSKFFYSARRYEESIEPCKEAVKIDPKCAQAYAFMGNAFEKLGKLDEAMKSFVKAIELEPSMTIAHFNLGGLYLRNGKEQEAVDEYLKIIQIDPDFLPAHSNLASIYLGQRRYNDAFKEWNEILRIDPNNADAKYNIEVYKSIIYK